MDLPGLSSSSLAVVTAVPALLPDWLNAETLLTSLGTFAFWASLAIVFAECGLFLFFMPGDSLLFVVGLFIASGVIDVNIWVACALLAIAAVLGNVVGYWIGYAIGPRLFNRPDSRVFKPAYLTKTHEFFEKYGATAIILARFVPIVRTFITAVAGAGRMSFTRFITFSAIGGVLWAAGVTLLGYWLGSIEFVKDNVEVILVLIVLVSVIPMAFEYLRHRRRAAAEASAQASPRSASE